MKDSTVQNGQLKPDAVGFWSGLAIALDSTAPAYSLAAVIALIIGAAALQAPAVLLLAFIPICLTSLAYKALNEVEPDCGTTFAWVRRSMGPGLGWVAGWVVVVTGILVIGSLAEIAAQYTYLLVGWDAAATSTNAIVAGAVAIIALSTFVTIRGTELSARAQSVMVVLQVSVLLVFAVWVLVEGGVESPSLSWINPFEIESFSALAAGLTIAVFIYWGWESALSLNEETKDGATSPGRVGLITTIVLLGTYLLVAYAVISYGGLEGAAEFEDDPAILAAYADAVLPGALDKFVVLAVLTSGLASTQTTILPASRTTLSMGRWGAFPRLFARIHPRYRTPAWGTAIVALAAVAYYVPTRLASEGNYLFDTITALGILIAFYYAITGFAAVVYFRNRFRHSTRDLLTLGVAPFAGAAILTWIFVKTIVDTADPAASYSGSSVFGIGIPLFVGAGFIVLGILGAVGWRLTGHGDYYASRPETAPPAGEQVDKVLTPA